MTTDHDRCAGLDIGRVWRALESWDQERPQSLEFAGGRVQLYMGAMEIPMLAIRPRIAPVPAADRIGGWRDPLAHFGLVLDCVSVSTNYKLNRAGSGEYVGRVLPDALKLHAERLLDLGPEALETIATLYFQLAEP